MALASSTELLPQKEFLPLVRQTPNAHKVLSNLATVVIKSAKKRAQKTK